MKKSHTFYLLLLLFVMIAVSCNKQSTIMGTWSLSTINMDTISTSDAGLAAMMGLNILGEGTSFHFTNEHDFEITYKDDTKPLKGTFTRENDSLHITANNENVDYKIIQISNDSLALKQDNGMYLKFSKEEK